MLQSQFFFLNIYENVTKEVSFSLPKSCHCIFQNHARLSWGQTEFKQVLGVVAKNEKNIKKVRREKRATFQGQFSFQVVYGPYTWNIFIRKVIRVKKRDKKYSKSKLIKCLAWLASTPCGKSNWKNDQVNIFKDYLHFISAGKIFIFYRNINGCNMFITRQISNILWLFEYALRWISPK